MGFRALFSLVSLWPVKRLRVGAFYFEVFNANEWLSPY